MAPAIEVDAPYAVDVPYSIWLSDGSFVFQEMVAPLLLTAEFATPVIEGGVESATPVVVNVKSLETARFPAASRDFTR
jgi:hypothetical protein